VERETAMIGKEVRGGAGVDHNKTGGFYHVSAVDSQWRTTWIVDPHREGKRFIVRVDEIPTAFLEPQRAIH